MFKKDDYIFIDISEDFLINGSMNSEINNKCGHFNKYIDDFEAEIIIENEKYILPIFCLKLKK